MTIDEQRAQKQAISMYPDDWKIVNRVAEKTGIRTLSAALRLIIREWQEAQQPTQECYEQQQNAAA